MAYKTWMVFNLRTFLFSLVVSIAPLANAGDKQHHEKQKPEEQRGKKQDDGLVIKDLLSLSQKYSPHQTNWNEVGEGITKAMERRGRKA